ncbi:unnamed protein product [Periconia digitata]|uniref:RING-type E3 ubiquitin transferase n=1 Tax=Periconia digitata TaxID=1303443 RepID=A0A9W4USJ5_9PLEO|nr:unnamed protein product [Periconia digitata]
MVDPDAPPAAAMSPTVSSSVKDDPDTCRICHMEGSPEEPLFFPCKCSGSIKYVHQDCLMEWLSHSQKKYCELCKTSFRFTKLYHPQMPARIPTSIFLRRASIHTVKMFVTWCRAILVASVWLVLLPWCMRVVWRSLFWVGDGGWTRDDYFLLVNQSAPSAANLEAMRSASATAATANSSIPLPLRPLLMPYSQTLNMTAGEMSMWTVLKRIVSGYSYQPPTTTELFANGTATNATVDYLGPRSPSLLSDVSFFNWFPSQAANRFLLDVLEGLVITLLVVVAFILIFLIREWVVQQQPAINMAAINDNAAAHRAPELEAEIGVVEEQEEGEAEEEAPPPPPRIILRDHPNPNANGRLDNDRGEVPFEIEQLERARAPRPRRSSSSRRRRRIQLDNGEIPEELQQLLANGPLDDLTRAVRDKSSEEQNDSSEAPESSSRSNPGSDGIEAEASSSRHPVFPERSSSLASNSYTAQEDDTETSALSSRPHMPARDKSFMATEIRRGLEENNTWSFADVPGPSGDVEKPEVENALDSRENDDTRQEDPGKSVARDTADREPWSESSSESWQQIPENGVDSAGSAHSGDKGKDKVVQTDPTDSNSARDSPSRAEEESDDLPVLPEPVSEVAADVSDDEWDSASESVNENHELGDGDAQEAEPTNVAEVAPAQAQPPVQENNVAAGLGDRVLNWMYRDLDAGVRAEEDDADDELVVQALEFEQFEQAIARNNDVPVLNAAVQDPEVAAAAAQAGIDVNDQEAIEDAEDLEGIMELIGMQGPLTGLFQNAMFSAVLISTTLACAVWLPYLWGKVVILFMGSPVALFVKLPLQIIATAADLAVDGTLCVAAGIVYWTMEGTRVVIKVSTLGFLNKMTEGPIAVIAGRAFNVFTSAGNRLSKLVTESPLLPPPTYFRLSINSHAALRTIQNTTSHTLNQTSAMLASICEDFPVETAPKLALQALRQVPSSIQSAVITVYSRVAALVSWLLTTKSYNVTLDLDMGRNISSTYTSMEHWTSTDRLIAVLAGYGFFAMAGAVYLRRGAPLTSSRQGQKIERIISEILQQAGGVLKVILIISIEMLVFPLYCGLLLDLALLPLFKDANVYTRWQFTRQNPWTSGFVHWFIGTCYMFHFALFVSMCRKILRKGVLYFIRDPDDPTFHPVRDVLERSVTTQLRKIAFSGLVYGGLVIVCLGGVVWALNQATVGVLPIHWVSHAPALEFPLDLLFYNFLTPVVIKFYKPSDGLHFISKWWFQLCARCLRMSNFLFGHQNKDEEGRKVNGEMIFDGKYVRAPASDQVRIPKGDPVFVQVDEDNNRQDNQSQSTGVHENPTLVTKVYIPPWFRVRIALFVMAIWIFAAATGISFTIIPLIFGRYLFSLFLPKHVEMNDIHAFSLGIYTLGSVVYTAYHAYNFLRSIHRPPNSPLTTLYTILSTSARIALRVARFTYVWAGLVATIPMLFAVVLEFYLLMPLHAYFGPRDPHVVHVIQDWTLGFLYARLGARLIFSDRASRPARAFAALIADGYLDPNAKIATRCFFVPAAAIFVGAIGGPALIAFILTRTVLLGTSPLAKTLVWRFAYPVVGLGVAAVWCANEGVGVLGRWRLVVKDEVYLIGERLHNFGEKRARGPVTPVVPVAGGGVPAPVPAPALAPAAGIGAA